MFIKTKIHVQNVHKEFPTDKGRLEVIADLDIKVGDGEFVAIVGPSGCGKTTLMNIIAGFLPPDSGSVLVDGQVRNGPSAKGILITQQGSVFPWLTVRQNLRPISPIAWIPLAILWFGVGNASPIYLIFIASVFPMIVQTTVGVHTIEKRYLRAAENFGVSRQKLFLRVVFPATLPQIITGMRIGLGVAWLVVVAAEMIALRSGLGYMIIDSRNAGNRYDLVIAGMIIIGLIGLALDGIMRLLEGMKVVRWRYVH